MRDSSRDICRWRKGYIDDESDVELDGNDQLDLDLDLEHNADDLESDLLSDSEESWLCRRILVILNSSRTGPKLENSNLLHSSPPVGFFKLFIIDHFVVKMAE